MTFTDQAIEPRQDPAGRGRAGQDHSGQHRRPTPGATATLTVARHSPVNTRSTTPVLDVAIPVYNEENDLEECLRRLHGHLQDSFPHSFRITVADNASTDSTLRIAERLAREIPEVAVVHLEEKGRGNALRKVWLASDAPVLAYMDVDLSTDLAALAPLLAPLISGHSDLAIGTRLTRNSRVVRGPKRELISRSYNLLLRSVMGARFTDAQCGFKAIRADVAHRILPHTLDNAWFFDTELLVLAERCGLRVHEVPVDWTDDPDSSVDILRTALADLRGMARLTRDLLTARIPIPELRAALARGPLPAAARYTERTRRNSLFGQLVRFGAIGAMSTLAYMLIFLVCRGFMDPQLANFLALLTTAIGNTAANRRFTFGIQGGSYVVRHHFEGLIVFGLGLALTSGALALVHTTTTPDRWAEIVTVTAANLAATGLRFLLFRLWVFRVPKPVAPPASSVPPSADALPASPSNRPATLSNHPATLSNRTGTLSNRTDKAIR
ncbi:bifunctional glycosyltransferase family 2/GtrA family protein [Arthrobacter sp. M4]|uniref:bifunctional glycosyltransferase family 2/GtrA family protein n=1 Tax=Arthrobacter sp. M4 TaxID=218160 RepID=UPI001CDCBF28|nr:bifunctional glycosyltransferase family 2/GtrA family protein [Arthrobacter sp. M4]MCA4134432.1 bifunctional glycosyltransferase family 2/GtrA family protein [Arthrobacter sp. M4]